MSKAKEFLEASKEQSTSIFPFKVENGEVVTSSGQTLLMANREHGTTPLTPVERDGLIHFVAELLNKNRKQYVAFMAKYMAR